VLPAVTTRGPSRACTCTPPVWSPGRFQRSGISRRALMARTGRNEPCPCGSGRKFKRCHGGPTPPRSTETGETCAQYLSRLEVYRKCKAFHEAGHAVVAWSCGHRVLRATIAEEKGEYAGCVCESSRRVESSGSPWWNRCAIKGGCEGISSRMLEWLRDATLTSAKPEPLCSPR